MIHTLQLGSTQFPVNLIQGPLAGVSCAPFRRLTWQYGRPAFSCTEMISCNALIHQPKKAQQRYLLKDPTEGPVCFQLSSADPAELAIAVKTVTDYGADLIDLNCGCPVRKIRRKGAGSSLLLDPLKLSRLIDVMKQNTHVPVSIKIRVQGRSDDTFHTELVKVIQESGVDFLIVHGRHWTENYETPCAYEDIKFFVEHLKIPVIGNGDIRCIGSLKKMFETGCAGVMISRAGMGQPWLIAKLMAEMQQQAFVLPSAEEVGDMFIVHVNELALLLNSEKLAIMQARKFAKYYARTLACKVEFCEAINHCERLAEFIGVCESFFKVVV